MLADAVELVRVEPGAKRDAADDEVREYHYGYDPDGLVTRIAEGPRPEPSRTWTVTNDPLGRPSSVEERARGDETPRTAQFTYDPDGNLTHHRVTAAGRDPETSHYTYNTLGLLSEALTEGPSTDGDEKKTTFTWWPTGRINRQTKDNGNTVFWARNTGRWTKAVDLAVGQWLRTAAGTYVQIAALKDSRRSSRVHNLMSGTRIRTMRWPGLCRSSSTTVVVLFRWMKQLTGLWHTLATMQRWFVPAVAECSS